MDESLRLKIIGDPSGAITSLNQVNTVAAGVASGVKTSFAGVSDIIKSSLGWLAGFEAIKKGLDLASAQEGLLRTQTELLKNQGTLGQQLAGGAKGWGIIAGTSNEYSKTLAQQAMQLSQNTGIQLNQITQAQNLLIPNSDLLTLFQKQKGSFQETTQAAANLASLMGGNMVASSRVLSRTLADPAKKMSSLTRYGFSLTVAQQAAIKGTNSLLGQQVLFIQDVNKSLGGVAQAAIPPMQRLSNDFQNILLSIGTGLLPLVDSFAKVLSNSSLIQGIATAFSALANAIGPIANVIGTEMGDAISALTPLINLFTQGIIPALMRIAQPFVTAASQILNAVGSVFNNPAVARVVTMMTELATVIIKAVQPSLNLIVKTFDQMASKNGPLTQFFDSLVKSLQIMAPLLPSLITLVMQLLVAFLPLMTTMLPTMATLIRIVADVANGISKVVTFITNMVEHMHGLFKIVAMGVGVLLAVWFTRDLFLKPIMGAIAQIRSLTATLLKMGIVGKEAFAGMSAGDKGFAGKLKGYQGGVAKAQTYLLEQQVGKKFQDKEISPRDYRREMRRISMQGPAFEEEMRRLRRSNNIVYGRLFGKEGGNFMSRLQTNLLGPNKTVLAEMMKASEKYEQGEEENDGALGENTRALHRLADHLGASKEQFGQLGQMSLLDEDGKPTYSNEEQLSLFKGQGENLASDLEKSVGKSGFLSRIAERFGGGMFGKIAGMLGGGGGIFGKVISSPPAL
jgi:hypothetical protein